jgi:hypothetical protein
LARQLLTQSQSSKTDLSGAKVMREPQPLHWKELTRAVKSEEDPSRILQLLHQLNQSLEFKARELAHDLLEEAA